MSSETFGDFSSSAIRRHKRNDVRIIYGVSFLIFLIAAVALRLMPWRWLGGSDKTVFEEARATTNRIMPFVFMA